MKHDKISAPGRRKLVSEFIYENLITGIDGTSSDDLAATDRLTRSYAEVRAQRFR